MKKQQQKICPHCGNPEPAEYKHVLSKSLTQPLLRLAQAGGAADSKTLDLGYSQRANAQKLKYWKIAETDGNGSWRLTELGWSFIRNQISLRKYVYTRKGTIIRYGGDHIFFNQISDNVITRPEYQEQARSQDAQKHLFD